MTTVPQGEGQKIEDVQENMVLSMSLSKASYYH